jgi:carbohydrate-selective porin OprB
MQSPSPNTNVTSKGEVMETSPRFYKILSFVLIALFSVSILAVAQDSKPATQPTTYNIATEKYLLGDWGGARTRLEEQKGVKFDFFYVSDLLANPKGGEQTATGWNRVRGTMDIDFHKLIGAKGLTFHVTGLWQGGVNLGGSYLGSISNPSGLVSAHTTRLDSFWLQQELFDGKFTIRAGQFAGMDFYGVQNYGGNYLMEPLDYAFGNLFTNYESFDPAAGPAAEIKIAPIKQFYFRFAGMSGNHDPYGSDTNGFGFTAKNNAVFLDEVGFLVDQPGGKNPKEKYYPGLYKVGSSFNGGPFLNPLTGLYEKKNYLVYFMGNQAIFRPNAGSNKGLDVHFGYDFAPTSVNKINRQVTGGFIYNGLIPKRGKDAVAFGFVYSNVSDNFSNASSLLGGPTFGSEKAFEINYLTQVTPWLMWQPVVQIYSDLGANTHNGTGVVAGFRTKVTF